MFINKAFKLAEYRQRKFNAENEKPSNEGIKNKLYVSRRMWPDSANPEINMNRLCNGKATSVSSDKLRKLCRELGVDPNFIYGFPSVHDEDYKAFGIVV